MTEFSWTKALDTVGRGVHDLDSIKRVRDIVDVLGMPQPPLHPYETTEALRLRAEARRLDKRATEIEQRAAVDE
jgi:hypothetical protein